MKVDFLKMISLHVATKNYLTDLLANEAATSLEEAKIKRDDACYLCKLIGSEDQELATFPAFEDVRSLHANFHGITAEILRLYQTGQRAKAAQLLHGRFEMVFRKIKSKVVLLSQEYNAGSHVSIQSNRRAKSIWVLRAPHF
ncbi:MAG: hypothetical protein U1C48_03465 [Methylotenera sp.]|nr:hypothetical protein [Methylotenera sp.]